MKHPFKASQMLQRASTSYKNNQAVSQEWICSTGLVWLQSQAVLLCKKCSVCAWERGKSILVEATLALSDTHLVRPWSCCEQEEFPGVQKSDITCTLLMAVSEATSRLICRNFSCNRKNLCKIPISLPWPVRSFSDGLITGKSALNCVFFTCALLTLGLIWFPCTAQEKTLLRVSQHLSVIKLLS